MHWMKHFRSHTKHVSSLSNRHVFPIPFLQRKLVVPEYIQRGTYQTTFPSTLMSLKLEIIAFPAMPR